MNTCPIEDVNTFEHFDITVGPYSLCTLPAARHVAGW